MKFTLAKVTEKELQAEEIKDIYMKIYRTIGIEPVGTHQAIVLRDAKSYLHEKDDGTMEQITPVDYKTYFMMITEHPAGYPQIKAIVKKYLATFEIRIGW